MIFFKKQAWKKELKEVLHYARHVRRMHEDLADPNRLDDLRALEKAGRMARRNGSVEQMEEAIGKLMDAARKLAPPRRHPKIRENVEVLFVAIAAAMAIRAYFFQPFKIPTGSMQPTLYGITLRQDPVLKGRDPVSRVANLVLFGERFQVVRAQADGRIRTVTGADGIPYLYGQIHSDETSTLYIGDVPHRIPNRLVPFCRFGVLLQKGDPIVQGVVKSGDYILVNRMRYNFMRPRRGDVAVFDTRDLTHPQVRTDAYYIKRMVGLPGDSVSIQPNGLLLINGKPPTDPRFDKLFNHPGYKGFRFASATQPRPFLSRPGDQIDLGPDEFLFFGDNTENSLDGRYFGPVHKKRLLGPAFLVCWPFDRAGSVEIPR